MINYKLLDRIPLEEAREEAKVVLEHTTMIADAFCATQKDEEDAKMRELLENVSYNIMKISTVKELMSL